MVLHSQHGRNKTKQMPGCRGRMGGPAVGTRNPMRELAQHSQVKPATATLESGSTQPPRFLEFWGANKDSFVFSWTSTLPICLSPSK